MTAQTLVPKQLVILSGKGGTGKTSVCAAWWIYPLNPPIRQSSPMPM